MRHWELLSLKVNRIGTYVRLGWKFKKYFVLGEIGLELTSCFAVWLDCLRLGEKGIGHTIA